MVQYVISAHVLKMNVAFISGEHIIYVVRSIHGLDYRVLLNVFPILAKANCF